MMRRGIVWMALAATLFACWWVEKEEQGQLAGQPDKTMAEPSPPRSPQVTPSVTLSQALPGLANVPPTDTKTVIVPVVVSVPVPDQAVGVNLFAALEMPSVDNAVAEAPAAINPYTYAGRLQESGRWTIFLTDGQQQYVLHEGDRFAEGWRVAVLDQQKIVLQHAAERFEIRLDNGVVF